ncbi:MAG: hypothetical protein ACR2HR_06240 [Euzebya sp.]
MSDQTAVHGSGAPTPTMVAAHLEALNLAGLGFATKRMLGKDPQRVTGQFTMWARQELPGLPGLTTPFWAALAPLGIGRPALDAATACDKVLRARMGDPEKSGQAAAACAQAGKVLVGKAPLSEDPGEDGEQAIHRAALVAAVKDYWRALGTVYDAVRARVITGEHPRAVRMVAKAERVLGEIIQQIEFLAVQVAGQSADQALAASPAVEPDSDQEELTRDHTPRRQGALPGDRQEVEAKAEAFAQSRQVRHEPEPVLAARPVEVLSTKPVRNRIFAPILFLLVVAGLALFVIFQVLNAPNPLAQ